jgi:hypothetical protein
MRGRLILALVTASLVVGLPAATAAAAGPPGSTLPFKVTVVKGKVKTYAFRIVVKVPPTLTLGPGLDPTATGAGNVKAPKGAQAAAEIKSIGKGTWLMRVVVDGRKAATGGTVAGTINLTGPLGGLPASDTPTPTSCRDWHQTDAGNVIAALWILIGPSSAGKALQSLAAC